MGRLMYGGPRICYDNGNSATGEKIYELHASCTCEDCQDRSSMRREPANQATVTTKDVLKIDEATEFLKDWSCENGKKLLEPVYFKF